MRASCDLPIEIWQQIYGYVPKDGAVRLCEVNRALYHIVMSERYTHVPCGKYSLGPDKHAQAIRYLL